MELEFLIWQDGIFILRQPTGYNLGVEKVLLQQYNKIQCNTAIKRSIFTRILTKDNP